MCTVLVCIIWPPYLYVKKADVLLFVVDDHTRAVASMVEASYFAGKIVFE